MFMQLQPFNTFEIHSRVDGKWVKILTINDGNRAYKLIKKYRKAEPYKPFKVVIK